jgi:uncharacterized membrane protein
MGFTWHVGAMTLAGNMALVIPAMVIAVYAIFRYKDIQTLPGKRFTVGFVIALFALPGLRIGHWIAAQMLRIPPDRYAEWSQVTSAFLTPVSAAVWLLGMILMAWGLRRHGTVWVPFGVMTLLSLLSGVLGYRLYPL